MLDTEFKTVEIYVKQTPDDFRVWGWIHNNSGSSAAAFWNLSGQKARLDFKSHGRWTYDLHKLARVQAKKGFEKMSLQELRVVWPNFDSVFEQEYTSFVLRQSAGI